MHTKYRWIYIQQKHKTPLFLKNERSKTAIQNHLILWFTFNYVNYINTLIAGLSCNFINEGNIKAHDFVEDINKMIEIINRLDSYLIIVQFIKHKNRRNTWRKKILVYFISLYCSKLTSIEKYFSILTQRVLNKGISISINQNSSKGKELIKQWTQGMKEIYIKSLWNHYPDDII